MSQLEHFIPLSPAEITVLKGKNKPALSFAIVISLGLVLFVYYMVSEWLRGSVVIDKGIVDPIVFVVVLLIGAAIVWFKLKGRGPLSADIREGQKKVIVAPMESQRERATERRFQPRGRLGMFFTNYEINYKYLVKVKSKEYPVSMEAYYELKPGSLVEVHEAPHSGQPLSVSPAKS